MVVIEPGLIRTGFAEAAVGTLAADPRGDGPYDDFNRAVGASTVGVYEGPFGRLGGGPENVARVNEKALTRRRPNTRYPVTASARLLMLQRRLSSDRMWDRLVGTQFPRP